MLTGVMGLGRGLRQQHGAALGAGCRCGARVRRGGGGREGPRGRERQGVHHLVTTPGACSSDDVSCAASSPRVDPAPTAVHAT